MKAIKTDTVENVKTLIVKVKVLIKKTIGLVRLGWIEFLRDCEAFIKANEVSIFQVGSTYEFGWIGDSEMKSEITITKRTNSFVTFTYGRETKKAKINFFDGSEYIFPEGKYSMCPTCKASKKIN
jgi:hypothetical protein